LILGELLNVGGKQPVYTAIINVFSPCLISEKYQLWEEIGQVKEQQNCQVWCIISDFNAVRFANERKGSRLTNQNSGEMIKFNDLTEQNELFDLPAVGRKIYVVPTKWNV